MSEQDSATQGALDSETVPNPAETAQDSGAEQTTETTSQEASPNPEPEKAKEKSAPTWVQRRIDQLTSEKWEERRAREQIEAENQRLRAMFEAQQRGEEVPPQRQAAPFNDDVVRAKAEELVRAKQFNDDCNRAYEAGKSEYPDFDDTLRNYQMLGGLPPALVEAALATEKPHEVLYRLGKDPEEAARVMSMAPTRMAVELAKIAYANPSKPKPVSKAPAPITPVDSAGAKVTADLSDEKLSMSEWIRLREQQRAKRA